MKISSTGLKSTIAGLTSIRRRIKRGFRGFEQPLRQWLLRRQVERFATDGASEGRRWAKYNPTYRRYKQALVKKGVISSMDKLRFKGSPNESLYPSLTRLGHKLQTWRVGSTGAKLGTNHPHARKLERGGVNQFGERFGGRDMTGLGARTSADLAALVLSEFMGKPTGTRWSA